MVSTEAVKWPVPRSFLDLERGEGKKLMATAVAAFEQWRPDLVKSLRVMRSRSEEAEREVGVLGEVMMSGLGEEQVVLRLGGRMAIWEVFRGQRAAVSVLGDDGELWQQRVYGLEEGEKAENVDLKEREPDQMSDFYRVSYNRVVEVRRTGPSYGVGVFAVGFGSELPRDPVVRDLGVDNGLYTRGRSMQDKQQMAVSRPVMGGNVWVRDVVAGVGLKGSRWLDYYDSSRTASLLRARLTPITRATGPISRERSTLGSVRMNSKDGEVFLVMAEAEGHGWHKAEPVGGFWDKLLGSGGEQAPDELVRVELKGDVQMWVENEPMATVSAVEFSGFENVAGLEVPPRPGQRGFVGAARTGERYGAGLGEEGLIEWVGEVA